MITNLKLHLLCCNQLSDAVIILTSYKKERRELELVANDKSMTVISRAAIVVAHNDNELNDGMCHLLVIGIYLLSVNVPLITWSDELTDDAWVSGPDLAPQKFLLSQKFRHLMGWRNMRKKIFLPCLVSEIQLFVYIFGLNSIKHPNNSSI